MKRYLLFFILFLILFSHPPTIFASGSSSDRSVYDTIHKSEKNPSPPVQNRVIDDESPSFFPIFIKFIFSFAFVIVLLVVLLRFLSKRTHRFKTNGPILPLGGYTLGNNRSVQMILIGQTIYVLGVGEHVTLLRSINQGEEYQHLLNGYEQQAEGLSTKWSQVLHKFLQKMDRGNGEE
jgi:flagellar protein FliO/FliZ